MLAGIWYGAQYGGSTTSILVNVPGEAASVVTAIDGYQMARKGRAGAALTIAAVGSFLAGTAGVVGLQLFAPAVGEIALVFGPPEYLAVAIFSLAVLARLTGKNALKSGAMAIAGVLLSTVGIDVWSGRARFTMGIPELLNGVEFLAVVVGLFGLPELFELAQTEIAPVRGKRLRLRDLYPTKEEITRATPAIGRGAVLGFLVGLLPGPSAAMSSFASYALEKSVARKYRDEFGRGAVEGVAGPESANNSATAGALVPLLSLGIPFSAPTAVLLAGLTMHNVIPGPLLIQEYPEIFWGVVVSMYVGNILLLVLNLPMVSLFARISLIPPRLLVPTVLAIATTGVYVVNNSLFDLMTMGVMGVAGVFLKRAGFEPAPLAVGLLMGPLLERSLMQSLVMGAGEAAYILTRPIATGILAVTVLVSLTPAIVARLITRRVPAFSPPGPGFGTRL